MVSYNVWRLVAASGGVISIYSSYSSSCKSENFEVTLLGGKKIINSGEREKKPPSPPQANQEF